MTQAIKSQGTTFSWNGTLVSEVKAIPGIGSGQATDIDVTHLMSTAKEYLLGLPDNGEITLALNFIPGDAGQEAMRDDRDSQTARTAVVTFSDGSTASFTALCKGWAPDVGTDAAVMLNVTIRVSGSITWATGA